VQAALWLWDGDADEDGTDLRLEGTPLYYHAKNGEGGKATSTSTSTSTWGPFLNELAIPLVIIRF
jgi:hypothetical protein